MLTALSTHIRWQDVVDVLLNSYILFRLYVLFRGTVALRVLTGIALLWFVQRIALSIGLIVTSWVMQGITAAGALIIIIIFRNEIRNVLQTRNLKNILWGISHPHVAEPPVQVMVESVYELARTRRGALLILPGRDDLKDLLQNGIPWRGLVSREMILSIFWPDNPVHDGAVVIRGNQVSQVGVILPLSRRTDFPSYFGTRHRAAAGLTEASDALVIVVSEERGRVSIAKKGQLIPIWDNLELTRALEEHLGIGAQSRAGFRLESVRLGAAALVSMMIVMGIWFSFSRGMETLITLDVPIEYMNRDPGMEILDTSVNSVSLQLSGSGALIRSVRPENVKIRIDLSKAVVGTNTYTITNDNISLPPGVVLKKVTPQVIMVTLDIPVSKELPVQVDWAGKLPDNLVLRSAKVIPDRVQVVGGRQILKEISTIYTEKVPLDKIRKSGSITVGLALNPASLKVGPNSKDKVTVEYVVSEPEKSK